MNYYCDTYGNTRTTTRGVLGAWAFHIGSDDVAFAAFTRGRVQTLKKTNSFMLMEYVALLRAFQALLDLNPSAQDTVTVYFSLRPLLETVRGRAPVDRQFTPLWKRMVSLHKKLSHRTTVILTTDGPLHTSASYRYSTELLRLEAARYLEIPQEYEFYSYEYPVSLVSHEPKQQGEFCLLLEKNTREEYDAIGIWYCHECKQLARISSRHRVEFSRYGIHISPSLVCPHKPCTAHGNVVDSVYRGIKSSTTPGENYL